MRAVGYVRVSTDVQSIEQQISAIKDFCKKEGLELIKIFEDPDVSGKLRFFDRQVVNEMLEFCKANNINLIIMYDITRFGRYDPIDILNDIRYLREKEFNVIFVSEPQIEDPHFRKLWEFIKGWFAEYERIQISQRTRLKILHKIEKGELAHRPTIFHYFASVYFDKELKDITIEDVEKVKPVVKLIVERALEKGIKKKKLLQYLREEDKYFKQIYLRYPKAPKSYWVIWKMLKELKLGV